MHADIHAQRARRAKSAHYIMHECSNCGIVVPGSECVRERCTACNSYWRIHNVERPEYLWRNVTRSVVDRSAWFPCGRCGLLVERGGLCEYCVEELNEELTCTSER